MDSLPTPELVREQFSKWLDENWNPDYSLREWREVFVDSGWSVPHWPTNRFGKGLPAWSEGVVASHLRQRGVPGLPIGGGTFLAAPTILDHGSAEIQERFLRDILIGATTWCQLFSEPGAGSDLAGLSTKAVRDGDEWVINGQKVWNTSAHHADYGILLARTDTEAPKHSGISYFILPMKQEGVLVRPLLQMNHHQSFNEVFLTVGDVNAGWTVANTTLAYERKFGATFGEIRQRGNGRAAAEAHEEWLHYMETYKWYPQRAGRVDLIPSRLAETGHASNAISRDEALKVLSLQRVSALTAERARVLRELGHAPGPEGSVGKLATSNAARAAAQIHARMTGAAAMLDSSEESTDGVISEVILSVPAQSIAGGTDEVQRNILGERILGLPREPR
jgi:alkylation response protein AidB-like acyl-CoA dehydrogenase